MKVTAWRLKYYAAVGAGVLLERSDLNAQESEIAAAVAPFLKRDSRHFGDVVRITYEFDEPGAVAALEALGHTFEREGCQTAGA